MDSSESPKLSLEDVLKFTVEDIRDKDCRSMKIWHLPKMELQSCLGKISCLEAQRDEMARTLGVDAKDLAKKLSCISPRREAPSVPPTPARTPSLYTPTPAPKSPATILALEPIREREAYEALIQDGGQPCHPIKPGFNILDKPEECNDIISYWKTRAFGGRLLFTGQLNEWGDFRTWQDDIRQKCVPKNRFSDYQRVVNERRQRHNLEGDANLRPKRIEQSALDDWIEYQNYHLHLLEILETEFKNAEEVLDAAKKKSNEVGDLEFEYVLEQEHFESSPSVWVLQERLSAARRERESAEQAVGLLKGPSKAAEFDSSQAASAISRLENLEKSENKLSLIVATKIFAKLKRDLERKRILLHWIEKQHPVIASRRETSIHDMEVIQNQGPAEEADSLNDADSSLLPHSGSSELTGQEKQHPVLRPSHESEVSKPISRKRILSPRTNSISRKANESAETSITSPSVFRRRSKRIATLKENIQAYNSEISPLHPLDQAGSGLSKTTKNASRVKRSTNLHTNPKSRDYRLRNNKNDGANHEPAARVPLRRSTRVSKKLERFCAG